MKHKETFQHIELHASCYLKITEAWKPIVRAFLLWTRKCIFNSNTTARHMIAWQVGHTVLHEMASSKIHLTDY